MGRVVLYLRSKHGMMLDTNDMNLLSNLMEARTHPAVLIDFLQNICHCTLDDADRTVITAFHVNREINLIIGEFTSRPKACQWN